MSEPELYLLFQGRIEEKEIHSKNYTYGILVADNSGYTNCRRYVASADNLNIDSRVIAFEDRGEPLSRLFQLKRIMRADEIAELRRELKGDLSDLISTLPIKS